MSFSYFGITEPLNSGYDFYTADLAINIEASFSANLNVASVPFTKIAFASVSISNILSTNLNAVFERQDGSVVMSASATVTVSMYREVYASSAISASANVDSSSIKISFAQANLSSSLNLSIPMLGIRLSSSAMSASATVLVDTVKIAFASASISNILDVNLVAVFERQDGSVAISATTNVVCGITKIAYASPDVSLSAMGAALTVDVEKIAISESSISSSLSVNNVPILKTSKANSAINVSSNMVASFMKLAFASSSMSSHLDMTILGKLSLMTIRINLLNNLNMFGSMIRYAANTSVGQDTTLIRNYLLINNKAITNHNREIQTSIEPMFVQNKNWNNLSSRYYKSTSRGSRKIFSISWTFVPNSKNATVDGNEGRDYLSSIAEDPDYHVLKIANMDAVGATPNTETSYNVLVKDYSETLIRRDMSSDTYYWDCTLTLEEV